MNKEEILKVVKQGWHVQGFISSVTLIYAPFFSGVRMKKYLSYSYTYLMDFWRDDYCEAYYGIDDLKKMWFEMEKEYLKDNEYFRKSRRRYRRIIDGYLPLRNSLDRLELSELSKIDFFTLCKQVFKWHFDTVCMCHDIEAFSLINDRKLRHKIRDILPDDINKYVELLSHPIKRSWANESELALLEMLKTNNETKREIMLKKHAEKYFWIRNNYLSAKPLTAEDFKEELMTIKDLKPIDYDGIRKKEIF